MTMAVTKTRFSRSRRSFDFAQALRQLAVAQTTVFA